MALEKLKILVEASSNPLRFDEANPIVALFNPNQIAVVKQANWRLLPANQRDTPAAQFTYGDPATLTIDLFFDTFESRADVRRRHTDRITALMTVERHGHFHRPPICQLAWGTPGVFFQGVLHNLNQRFTLFLEDGTPVRATCTCAFREWRSDEEEERAQNRSSTDVVKTHTVKRGDTLSSIASEHYSDPALWRPIAEANRIDNPRALQPGSVLAIPALHPGGAVRR
jgi:nucleoid-associated protein YgaU